MRGAGENLPGDTLRSPPRAVEALAVILDALAKREGVFAVHWLAELRQSETGHARLLRECLLLAYNRNGKIPGVSTCQINKAVLAFAQSWVEPSGGGAPSGRVPFQGGRPEGGGTLTIGNNPAKFLLSPPTNRGVEFSPQDENLENPASVAGQGGTHSICKVQCRRSDELVPEGLVSQTLQLNALDRDTPEMLDVPEKPTFFGLPSGERRKRAKSYFASDNNSYQNQLSILIYI